MMDTMHVYRGYMFSIRNEPGESAQYSVNFPDIPEIITSGDTLPEAFSNACEALDLLLDSLQELGKPMPAIRHRLIVNVA
jgi:predicted RNase H-like HicB family nuclease